MGRDRSTASKLSSTEDLGWFVLTQSPFLFLERGIRSFLNAVELNLSKRKVSTILMVGINEHNRPYQPINSYGVIGDCHSVILVAPDGSMDWGCLPDFDSPAIFCRLLDAERGGYFQVAPSDNTIPGSQRYLQRSNVLQTYFANITGEIVSTDFMPIKTLRALPYKGMDNNTWRVDENGSCHCLVRIVECTHGEMPVTMRLKVSPNYAAAPSQVSLVAGNLG